MPTELQSRLDSGEIASARYYYQRSGRQRQVCRSTGYVLLRQAQQLFVEVLLDVGPLPAPGGVRIAASAVSTLDPSVGGDGWNEASLKALYAVASYARAPGSFLAAISQDIMLHTLSMRTVQTAIWLGYSVTEDQGVPDPHYGAGKHIGTGSPNEITFPPGTILPRYGSTPPLPPTGIDARPECHVEGQGVAAGPPVQAESSLRLTVPLILGAAATAILVATVTTAGAPTRKDLRDAQKARANPSGRPIVAAWMTTRVASLPGVTKPRAVAAMWLNDGGPKDVEAAKAYVNNFARTNEGITGQRVFIYEHGESNPLERARRELAASRSNPSFEFGKPEVSSKSIMVWLGLPGTAVKVEDGFDGTYRVSMYSGMAEGLRRTSVNLRAADMKSAAKAGVVHIRKHGGEVSWVRDDDLPLPKRKNPSISEKSGLVQLQQAVMAELHRAGLWTSGMRAREINGNLRISGNTAGASDKIGNVWRDTRIPRIARLLGYAVLDTDNGWSLTFEPISDRYTDWSSSWFATGAL